MHPNIIVVYQSLAFRQPWEGATFFWLVYTCWQSAIEYEVEYEDEEVDEDEDEDEEVEPIFPRSGVLHYSLAPMVCCTNVLQ